MAEPVDEEVVDHAARLVEHAGVLRAADLDLRDVVGHQALEEGDGTGALDLDLAHVGYVEDAGPAGEGDHLRPGFDMQVIERSTAGSKRGSHPASLREEALRPR